jgi:8-oxo-dGTP diphosphatase
VCEDLPVEPRFATIVSAAALLIDREARVLLAQQNYGNRRWALPGGLVEPGESPDEAAVREAHEETGLVVELEHLIALYYVRGVEPPRLGFVFAAQITGGSLELPSSGELADLGWFPVTNLPENLSRFVPLALRHATAGARGAFETIDLTPSG